MPCSNLSRAMSLGLAMLTFAGAAVAQPSVATPNQDSSGPQSAVPPPALQGRPDVPGGSAFNGVIAPPSAAPMRTIKPGAAGRMPVIKPPGTGGDGSSVQPK